MTVVRPLPYAPRHDCPNPSTVRSAAARPRGLVRARGRPAGRRAPGVPARIRGRGSGRPAAERDRSRGAARLSALPVPRARPARARARPSATPTRARRRPTSRLPRRACGRAGRDGPSPRVAREPCLAAAMADVPRGFRSRQSPTPSCAASAHAPRSCSTPKTPRARRSSCGSRRNDCRPNARPCSTGCARAARSRRSSSSSACARCSRTVRPPFARTIARDLPRGARAAAPAVGGSAREARAHDRRVPAGSRDPASRRARRCSPAGPSSHAARRSRRRRATSKSRRSSGRERAGDYALALAFGLAWDRRAPEALAAFAKLPAGGSTTTPAHGKRAPRSGRGTGSRSSARSTACRARSRRRRAGNTGRRARPRRATTARAPRRFTRRSYRATTTTRRTRRCASAANRSRIRNGSR